MNPTKFILLSSSEKTFLPWNQDNLISENFTFRGMKIHKEAKSCKNSSGILKNIKYGEDEKTYKKISTGNSAYL